MFRKRPRKKCIWKRICQIHQIRWIKYKCKYKYMVWNLIKYKYKYAVFVFVFVFANTNTYLTPALVLRCERGASHLPYPRPYLPTVECSNATFLHHNDIGVWQTPLSSFTDSLECDNITFLHLTSKVIAVGVWQRHCPPVWHRSVLWTSRPRWFRWLWFL